MKRILLPARGIFPSAIFLAFLLINTNCLAQDYPYDDAPATETNAATDNSDEKLKLPKGVAIEKSTDALGDRQLSKRRYHALYRLGFKAGGNFTFLQSPSAITSAITESYTGWGFEGNLSLGWDLPYQPIFLELESGYREILLRSSVNPIQIVPFTFGTHYRYRFGATSLWKPGLKTSFELRFTRDSNTGARVFSGNPVVAFSSLLEFGNFLVEPLVTVARIQPQYTFLTFSMKAGYRF